MASLKQEYSRQDINDSKTKIDELTARVAQDKTNISDLEDELRQAGGDPGWATPPSQPDQGQSAAVQPASDQPASTQPPEAQPPVGVPAVPPQP